MKIAVNYQILILIQCEVYELAYAVFIYLLMYLRRNIPKLSRGREEVQTIGKGGQLPLTHSSLNTAVWVFVLVCEYKVKLPINVVLLCYG